MAGNVDHDALTMQLMEFVPNATPEQATQYLSANNWDLDAAAASIMADMEEADDDAAQAPAAGASASSSAASAAPAGYSGPRTLDGRPAPQAAYSGSSSSSRKKAAPKKKGVATLSSLGAGADDDDDDSEDEDDDDPRRPRDLFAGGEKSGLAVQDPNRRGGPDPRSIAQDLVNQAKSNQQQRPEASTPAGPSAPSSAFRGPAQTLGGEGVESQAIPAHPSSGPRGGQAQPSGPVQERTLHLWRDGFSIDDGALRRYDDPANADDLRMIQNGRAPVHLMNVRYDEPLDVKLQQHEEDFHQLPKIYRPFSGEGRRLGSPVPGDGGASIDSAVSAQPTTAAPAASASSAAAPASTASTTEVDSSQPVVMIRIQMLDGTRLPARFNTTHTIGDVYDFISRSSPSLPSGWVLSTTFPNKDHTDKSLVLGDLVEFKKGGTAVVKRST